MKEYSFDYKQSKELYDNCKSRIEMKGCYRNVFHVVTDMRYANKFRDGEWKVAYGVMPSVSNAVVRHCFIVDGAGRAIDPTVFTVDERENKDGTVYMAYMVYDDVDQYIQAVEKNDYYPDLLRPLREKDIAAFKELQEKGYVMLGW